MTQEAVGGDPSTVRMRLAREWDDLVEQVRLRPGFEDFLRPPPLPKLLPAAEGGPVVVINASRWGCHALLVRADGVVNLALPGLTLTETQERAYSYLQVLGRSQEAAREHDAAVREQRASGPAAGAETQRKVVQAARAFLRVQGEVDLLLTDLQRWMWDSIAEPVLDRLGYTSTPPGEPDLWPRIWWCPTGPLTLLPLHTAGHHLDATDGRTVLDRVVSSYTPTVRALLEARTGRRSSAENAPDAGRMLLVEVPDARGQAPLNVEPERAALTSGLTPERLTHLLGRQATRAAVLDVLPEHRWVHFSCHGDQDLLEPSRGGLLLYDGMLTVADITARDFDGEFAGLSACKTAVGGLELSDEAITLAAALHYTGYRRVVATLWSVHDSDAADLFAHLYAQITDDGVLHPARSAAALHAAVHHLRDRFRDFPHRWSPFVHIGP
jgi:hypothetical protein